MKLVFNDGIIAGVSIGLSGDRARYLRGLDFEILYKKVSEGLGVYQVELRVPDAIRQIELGQVSITIPIVALEIYTNGNFRVDLGFPKNNDFSRLFQLQVFPFIGSGGFYLAGWEGRPPSACRATRYTSRKHSIRCWSSGSGCASAWGRASSGAFLMRS